MNKDAILSARMVRQGFGESRARDEADYRRLFRRLQPVAPMHFSMPGSPPRLVHRTHFDDAGLADQLRGQRELVKGRFCGGLIAYVLADDLELYGTAFRKPLDRFDEIHENILATLRATGPLSTRLLREEVGVTHKKLMPALHRLQRAFLLYEDQEDESWERPWCLFDAEWPQVDLERRPWAQAAAEVARRLLQSLVWATAEQICSWSGFAKRQVRDLLQEMAAGGSIAMGEEVDELGGSGWMLGEGDGPEESPPPASVAMLHKADPLVWAHTAELKERFADREVLQYLLVDGQLTGAVCGHWRIKAHDVADVVTGLSASRSAQRREEVLAEVLRGYRPPASRVVRYEGSPLEPEAAAPARG